MTLDVEQRSAAARRRLALIIAAIVALVVLVAALVVALLRDDPEQTTRPSAPRDTVPAFSTEAPSETRQPLPGGGGNGTAWVPPARQVTLPSGSKRIGDYPVGFPQTPVGAAAAEVAKDRYSSTVDYAEANRLARIYIAPDLASYADDASTLAVRTLREQLGVPATGAAPTSSYSTSLPIGVQWERLSNGDVEVEVLVEAKFVTPARTWTQLGAAKTVWRWIDEPGRGPDWRLVSADTPDAPLVQIGKAAFNDAGWSAIVTEEDG